MAGEGIMETADKTAPSVAITEKRANRLGGCVGIFFQLFDWNRRFSKKKLFSRQPLLPGKQASKRFGGNEKMSKSKHDLIADENRGGFPKRSEVEMRSPGLMARLMGLESMPSIHRDKPKKKKSSLSQFGNKISQEDELLVECNVFCNSSSSSREEASGFEKSRPLKIQKHGSEALQIKNVLTQVRKHHQNRHHQYQILASPPVRTPRLHRKNSRWMNAAARILEPGLQAKKSPKCAIAYPGSRSCENIGKDPVEAVSPDTFGFQHSYNLTSCKNCGSFVDVLGSGEVIEEKGQVSESSSSCLKERNVACGNQEPCVFAATKGVRSDWITDDNKVERKALRVNHRKNETVSSGLRNKNNFHNQLLQRERYPQEARVHHSSQSKRSCSSPEIAVNHKAKGFLPSRNRPCFPRKTENSELNLQRNPHSRRFEDCSKPGLSSSASRRRIVCVSEQGQGGTFSCGSSRESKFGLPGKGNSRSCREVKERKGLQLDADMVRLLLHQKLKELASQQEDETGRGSASQSKRASVIIQELISSLALEQPYAEKAYRREGKTEVGSPLGQAHNNSDYTSPGSVLDASFSNESCFSSSLGDNSGQVRLPLEPTELDMDILEDSATSIKKSMTSNFRAITDLINHVSHLLHGLRHMGLIPTQSRFINARDVIIQTELFFGTQEVFLICPKLLDELMIQAAQSKSLVKVPGLTGGFLVDAMIEYCELRYCRHIFSGLKQWRMLHLRVDSNGLIREVLEEATKWTQMTGMYLEEIISIEMERWLDFETYVSELGTEIAWEILCCLVGEITADLRKRLPENHRE
ncbi:PREDICTED: uncharacterized protein LOC104822621 [Tarenaya hassleriana]|uniref:uncharacterized protein LOC104822621 n=1 Tax=Tarenaya hassleriana TaxID=28532 RepID=UPI00053C6725|nr:PREDICTED: uncharacterized protein LOC104822621 [Tarenaya hassleriana]XP_010552203.1 PREDICTED: uncharacterized protein LOC104822621 [Tarenaya hassleriana]